MEVNVKMFWNFGKYILYHHRLEQFLTLIPAVRTSREKQDQWRDEYIYVYRKRTSKHGIEIRENKMELRSGRPWKIKKHRRVWQGGKGTLLNFLLQLELRQETTEDHRVRRRIETTGDHRVLRRLETTGDHEYWGD